MSTPPDPAGQRYLAERYRLEEVLGQGATGTVWAAYDEVLRRRVAVKEVPPPPGMPEPEADELRERTLREARSIAVLSHPNVVTLYDVVRQGGEPFVVMELLPADSLARVVGERGPLDVSGTALVGYAVASALLAAHESGITHRDVKPGNVLIGSGGQIKLTDFGIARNVAEQTMTVAGMTLGSPAFIAPEVASGGQVTPAADLWGLGATLFAAVQGHPPYDANGDPLATVAAVVHDEVPRASAAGPLEPVISGLMVKDPALRMPLTEVRRMLRPLLPPDGRVLREAPETTVLPAITEPPAGAPGRPAVHGAAPGTPAYPAAAELADAQTTRTPLAADPGPLPFSLPAPPPRPPRRRSGLATAALALAAVLFFGVGTAGGFGLSRWATGAPLLPEVPETQIAPREDAGESGLRSQEVAVTNDQPGTTDRPDTTEPLLTRFTIGIPDGWTAYRPPLSTAGPPIVATFVSPEGNRTITVELLRDHYPRTTAQDYLNLLQARLAKSVDHVVVPQLPNLVGQPSPGATEGPYQASFRTVQRGSRGDTGELLRTMLVYLLPVRTDLWVIRVTVPSDQQKAADALFSDVVASFQPLTP